MSKQGKNTIETDQTKKKNQDPSKGLPIKICFRRCLNQSKHSANLIHGGRSFQRVGAKTAKAQFTSLLIYSWSGEWIKGGD